MWIGKVTLMTDDITILKIMDVYLIKAQMHV